MRKTVLQLILTAILICFFTLSNAQISQNPSFQQQSIESTESMDDGPGDPYCDPLCNCRKDGSICPIDNGVFILLAIGMFYGIVKVRSSKTQKTGR